MENLVGLHDIFINFLVTIFFVVVLRVPQLVSGYLRILKDKSAPGLV